MRRMYSKKQLEELISNMSGDILEVKNIKQLNDEQCNGLKVGDIVAKKTGKQYHCYIVTYKQDKHGLCLSYFDASVVETQSYDYTEGHWVYNSEDKTELGGSGLPEVTGADNGKVLEVLNGAWGVGEIKANAITAPTSANLTEDEKAKIISGALMNGTFLGFKNPLFHPAIKSGNYYYGIVEGGNEDNFYIDSYTIDGSNNIAVGNTYVRFNRTHPNAMVFQSNWYYDPDHKMPAIPNDSVNTYTLKLVAGTLTWVQDV